MPFLGKMKAAISGQVWYDCLDSCCLQEADAGAFLYNVIWAEDSTS